MIFAQLRKQGILGMNARIGRYMSPFNPRHLYPLVDDKTKTTALASEYAVQVPETYFIFESYGDLKNLAPILEPYASFVLKPAKGAMGHGIVVIERREGDRFIHSSGKQLSLQDLKDRISQTMSGLYSLNGVPDRAILQYTVKLHPAFADYAVRGIPDVRVIVYQGYPLMAMVRLPTRESEGRANLHQGAVGAGIDLLSGRVTGAIHHNRFVDRHPDTGQTFAGLAIPAWHDLLLIAAKGYEMTGMGYIGVDLVVDREKGPMLLEMNARPGLSIQIANCLGLGKVLHHLKATPAGEESPEVRVARALAQWAQLNK